MRQVCVRSVIRKTDTLEESRHCAVRLGAADAARGVRVPNATPWHGLAWPTSTTRRPRQLKWMVTAQCVVDAVRVDAQGTVPRACSTR